MWLNVFSARDLKVIHFDVEYEEYEQEPDVATDIQVDNDVEANLVPVPHRRSTNVTGSPIRYSPSKYYLFREEGEMLCIVYIVCIMLYRRARLDALFLWCTLYLIMLLGRHIIGLL